MASSSTSVRAVNTAGRIRLLPSCPAAHSPWRTPAHLDQRRRARRAPVPIELTSPNEPLIQGLLVTRHTLIRSEHHDQLGRPLSREECQIKPPEQRRLVAFDRDFVPISATFDGPTDAPVSVESPADTS